MASRTVKDMSPETLKHFDPFLIMLQQQTNLTSRQKAAKDTAQSLAKILKERFHATKVMLFGSALRSDFSQWSDIDLAVWGISNTTYFKAVAYSSGFSSVFKIDLVDADDCSESLYRHISESGVEL